MTFAVGNLAFMGKPFKEMHIKKLRERLRPEMSQERLAEIMDVDKMTVSRWERGERVPRGQKLPKLAKALKVSVAELYREPTNDEISLDAEVIGTSKTFKKQALAVIRAMKEQAGEEGKK